MYNDKLVYKIVIWAFWGVILWKEKEALSSICYLSVQTAVMFSLKGVY